MKYYLGAAVLMLVAGFGAGSAQDAGTAPPKTPPQPICEAQPGFHQFDFWLGEWDVYGSVNGKHAGTNRIEKVEKGCLIMEYWTSDRGGTGRSMNFYDPVADEWRQVWVSNGYSINYAGGLNEAGEMVLEGDLHGYRAGISAPFRGTWTANDDGSVRQFFEQYDAENKIWKVWFDGKYIRKD